MKNEPMLTVGYLNRFRKILLYTHRLIANTSRARGLAMVTVSTVQPVRHPERTVASTLVRTKTWIFDASIFKEKRHDEA